jgi:hypothetical protein
MIKAVPSTDVVQSWRRHGSDTSADAGKGFVIDNLFTLAALNASVTTITPMAMATLMITHGHHGHGKSTKKVAARTMTTTSSTR